MDKSKDYVTLVCYVSTALSNENPKKHAKIIKTLKIFFVVYISFEGMEIWQITLMIPEGKSEP